MGDRKPGIENGQKNGRLTTPKASGGCTAAEKAAAALKSLAPECTRRSTQRTAVPLLLHGGALSTFSEGQSLNKDKQKAVQVKIYNIFVV